MKPKFLEERGTLTEAAAAKVFLAQLEFQTLELKRLAQNISSHMNHRDVVNLVNDISRIMLKASQK